MDTNSDDENDGVHVKPDTHQAGGAPEGRSVRFDHFARASDADFEGPGPIPRLRKVLFDSFAKNSDVAFGGPIPIPRPPLNRDFPKLWFEVSEYLRHCHFLLQIDWIAMLTLDQYAYANARNHRRNGPK